MSPPRIFTTTRSIFSLSTVSPKAATLKTTARTIPSPAPRWRSSWCARFTAATISLRRRHLTSPMSSPATSASSGFRRCTSSVSRRDAPRGSYCPNDSVTRDQMAIFIIRVRLGWLWPRRIHRSRIPATPSFTDDPTDDFAFPWVQRMKQEGITSGCTATTYCPGDPVTRGADGDLHHAGRVQSAVARGDAGDDADQSRDAAPQAYRGRSRLRASTRTSCRARRR